MTTRSAALRRQQLIENERLERLRRAVEVGRHDLPDVENQINRADAKALGILSALAMITGLAILGIGGFNGLAIRIGGLGAILGFIVALAGALKVLEPRTKGSHNPRGSAATRADLLFRSEADKELDHVSIQLANRRKVLATKHRWLGWGFKILYGSLFLLVLVLGWAVIFNS
jgi:hypothetical protein